MDTLNKEKGPINDIKIKDLCVEDKKRIAELVQRFEKLY